MTPELKAKWLADLRSGKYPKTTAHLKDNHGYCCLGVLCESAGVKFSTELDEVHVTIPSGTFVDVTYAPEPVNGVSIHHCNELNNDGRDLFGLSEHDHDELTTINDATDTFEEVIEYIEKHVECEIKTMEEA